MSHDLDWDLHLGRTDLSGLPEARPWRSFALDAETRGPWVIAGDLNGDGVCELVIARAQQVAPDEHATVSVVALDLDGQEIWRWGAPEQGTENLWHDIACQIPISFIQAALGDKITVPTLEGEKQIDIPKGTQPGDVLRLSGEGIPSLRGKRRGDQIIQVIVKTPTNMTKKQEALLREFSKIESKKLTNKIKTILKG